MDAHAPWVPVPLLFANAESGGPVEHGFFLDVVQELRRGLTDALPLDGVYICEHGAAITTEEADPDGLVFALVREIVGPSVAGCRNRRSACELFRNAWSVPLIL